MTTERLTAFVSLQHYCVRYANRENTKLLKVNEIIFIECKAVFIFSSQIYIGTLTNKKEKRKTILKCTGLYLTLYLPLDKALHKKT